MNSATPQIGDAGAGLISLTGRAIHGGTPHYIRSRSDGGNSRHWIFCMNQLGGVGRHKWQASGPGNRGGVSQGCKEKAAESRINYPLGWHANSQADLTHSRRPGPPTALSEELALAAWLKGTAVLRSLRLELTCDECPSALTCVFNGHGGATVTLNVLGGALPPLIMTRTSDGRASFVLAASSGDDSATITPDCTAKELAEGISVTATEDQQPVLSGLTITLKDATAVMGVGQ